MTRPRTFCWVQSLRGPAPQIIFEPRVGCASTTILPGASIKLDPADTRTLDQLAADYPAPKETV